MMTTKEENTEQNIAGQMPKGVGISQKAFSIVSAVIIVLFLSVIIMIFHYKGAKKTIHAKTPTTLVSQENAISAEEAIQALNANQKHDGDLMPKEAKSKTITKSDDVVYSEKPANLPDQAFKDAAKSSISVVNNYHGPSMSSVVSSNDDYQQKINGLTAQSNNLANLAKSSIESLGNNGLHAGYKQQNMQSEKIAFLREAQKGNKFYLKSKLQKPLSPYEVKAGSLIPAVLLTGIDSDLPGQITAKVSRNVYDTVTGNYLLIPQGTTIIGIYDSQITYGQSRVIIAWNRLIYPNGDSFDLAGQPGVDLTGMAGLHDLVNNHYYRIFGSALLFSLFGAAGQLSQPQQTGSVLSNQQIIYGAIGQQMSQTGAQLIAKNMNIQPTITIRQGANFNILLTRDMVLPGPYKG